MPFIYPTPSEVTQVAKWQAALKSDNFGNPKIAGRTQLLEYVNRAHVWSQKSMTAQAILATVLHCQQEIFFIGMRNGGYSCFDSDCPDVGQGTVYFNLDVVLKVRIRSGVDTKTMVPKTDWKTQKPVKTGETRPSREPVYQPDKIDVDPLIIAFLHELGHAKQFIENPNMFTRRAHGTGKEIEEIGKGVIEDAARHWATGLGTESRKALATDPRFHFASKRPANPQPAQFVVNPKRPTYTQARSDQYLGLSNTRLTKPAWGVKLETDNLIRHEWPICRELGWPDAHLRHYTDIEEIYA